MLVVIDGTNLKTLTFDKKRPKVHHFLYPTVQILIGKKYVS